VATNTDLLRKSGFNFTYWFRASTGHTRLFHIFSGDDPEWEFDTTTISAGTLYLLAVSYSGAVDADPVSVINGVLQNTTELDIPTGTISPDTTGTFSIYDGGAASPGVVHEVAVWTTVLTQAQMEQLTIARTRHMPLQINTANLLAYWVLDDEEEGSSADGDTFRDYKGTHTCTGNDGANNTGLTARAEQAVSYP